MQNELVYKTCIADMLNTEQVESMIAIRHHPKTSCLEHSIFVSYLSFLVAYKLHLDYKAAARAGLLHDLYLYNPKDKAAYHGLLAFAHPKDALHNAERLFDLTPKEKNIIIAHMWPLATHIPRSREAWVVSTIDKVCCVVETLGYLRRARKAWIAKFIRERLAYNHFTMQYTIS